MPKFNEVNNKSKSVVQNTAGLAINQGGKPIGVPSKQKVGKKRCNENIGTRNGPQKKKAAVLGGPVLGGTVLGDLTNAIGKSIVGNNRIFQNNIKNKADLKLKKENTEQKRNTSCQSATVTSFQGSSKILTENRSESIKNNNEKKPVVSEKPKLPEGVTDIDEENKHDPLVVPEYAKDIFKYHKEREEKFLLKPYLHKQPGLTGRIRAILVDWLVELQEIMEVNHETLYQAVKMIDQFLEKRTVPIERLQLLGATAMLISCKYEERCCPLIADFLYTCDNCYSHEDMLQMEVEILKTIDFEIGAPLSYRFLRRYAKSDKIGMDLLTLARYVLEMSLHDYGMVFELESIKAAASLYLALRMKGQDWTPQLQYYSGYKKEQLLEMARRLNVILHNPIKDVRNVTNKYSHRVFFEAAKVPLLPQNSPSLQEVEDAPMKS